MSGAGTLWVCAVPIGNLEDATPRLRRVLGEVDAVACEDTRVTGRLLELLEVTPRPRLLAHHEHNERASAVGIVALLADGADVALVSDAGMPAVSDPGATLVDAVHEAGMPVVVVPGASAVASAVAVAGFPAGGYRFAAFLPRQERELGALLERHAAEVLVAFESPHRLLGTLDAIALVQPQRRIAVCRELTKRHEEVVRGTAGELAVRFAGTVKGELVLVLDALPAPPAATTELDPRALALVRALVEEEGLRTKAAARIVAAHLGGSARALFDAANADRDGET